MWSDISYDRTKMFDNLHEQTKLYEKLLVLKYEEDEMVKDLMFKPVGAKLFEAISKSRKK